MKRRTTTIVILLIICLPIVYVLYGTSSLIALILEDGLEDSVTLDMIEASGNRSDAQHPIPKIIHQTWKNENIPEQWQIAQFSWSV